MTDLKVTYSDDIIVRVRNSSGVTVELAAQGPSGPPGAQGAQGIPGQVYDEFTALIQAAAGIAPGTYPVSRSARRPGTITEISLELLDGSVNGSVDLALVIAGVMVWGPSNVMAGAGKLSFTGLNIPFVKGARVDWVVTYSTGASATSVWAQAAGSMT